MNRTRFLTILKTFQVSKTWKVCLKICLVLLAAIFIACTQTPLDAHREPLATPVNIPPAAPQPHQITSLDKWSLWTGGTHLRGANIYQRHVYPDLDGTDFMGPGPLGPPYTQADFDRLAALGANYVNISHPGLFSEAEPYTVDLQVQNNLDHLLAMIAKADMFAVITFRTGPGRSEFWAFWGDDNVSDPDDGWFPPSYYNNRMWGDQKAQDAWVAMWRYTAQRYKDNPIVVGYDLMCEPNSNEVGAYPAGDPLDIWDPDEFYKTYGGTLYDWNQLYPRISAAIRQVDTSTPILIGCMAYSHIDWLPYVQPTGDQRTVYTVHQYDPMVYTHQVPPDLVNTYPGVFDTDWDGTPDQFDRAWIDNWLSTIDTFTNTHQVPVAVNEFGAMRWEPNVADFMDDEMNLFQQRGLNHALWLWEASWPPLQEIVDAFNFRHGPDPDHHADVTTSDLIKVITAHWERNTIRPSVVTLTATPTPITTITPTTTPTATSTLTPTATPLSGGRSDGAELLYAPGAPASAQNPAFSPDGSRLVFTRFDHGYNIGPAGLFLLDLATAAVTRLTPAEDQDNVNLPGSAWNVTNDRIIFASDRLEADDLWRIAPDGSDFNRITTHTGLPWYIEPSWSPGGQWIVFEVDRPGNSEDGSVGQIWKVRADGSDLTQLTGKSSLMQGGADGETDDRQPNWSPAGDRILFQRRTLPDGQWDIYTIAPDGTGLQNVTADPNASDTDASWSPDGACIVYSSDHGGLPMPNIQIIPASGGAVVRVTSSTTQEDGAPSWSPALPTSGSSYGGQWIAFESHLGQDEDTPAALWRIAVPAGVCDRALAHRYLPVILAVSPF